MAIVDLLGRLHPLLVHLPIGILLLACLMQWLSGYNRFHAVAVALPLMFLLGAIGAAASCISGYLLSENNAYDIPLIDQHFWSGITVFVFSSLIYAAIHFKVKAVILRWGTLVLAIAISVTGHLGGSLTHGPDYLSAAFSDDKEIVPALKPIANIQDAMLYRDVVAPLLQERCYSCHGPNKVKGNLRLDSEDYLRKGGEDGIVFLEGQPGSSALIQRLLLAKDDKKHMPPRQQPQLTQDEIAILHWWIASGASFDQPIKSLPQNEQVKTHLLAFETGQHQTEVEIGLQRIPSAPISPADITAINLLKSTGAIVLPVAQNSNYLSVNFVNLDSPVHVAVMRLLPLQKHITWLNASDLIMADSLMDKIAGLENLTRLNLNNSHITDSGLVQIAGLTQLQYLNISRTQVSLQGIAALRNIPSLKSIYLYQSSISSTDYPQLKQLFPKTLIDTGGYVVPTLAKDTTEVKAPG